MGSELHRSEMSPRSPIDIYIYLVTRYVVNIAKKRSLGIITRWPAAYSQTKRNQKYKVINLMSKC